MTEQRNASISTDGVFRHSLGRMWDSTRPFVAWCGENPSTADGTVDDPTIRKERGFTKRLASADGGDFGGFIKFNLFDLRATKPSALLACYRAGKMCSSIYNDPAINLIIESPLVEIIIVAWGGIHKELRWRIPEVEAMLRASKKPLFCFGYTNDGQPRHPLMLSYNTTCVPWVNKG